MKYDDHRWRLLNVLVVLSIQMYSNNEEFNSKQRIIVSDLFDQPHYITRFIEEHNKYELVSSRRIGSALFGRFTNWHSNCCSAPQWSINKWFPVTWLSPYTCHLFGWTSGRSGLSKGHSNVACSDVLLEILYWRLYGIPEFMPKIIIKPQIPLFFFIYSCFFLQASGEWQEIPRAAAAPFEIGHRGIGAGGRCSDLGRTGNYKSNV